MKRIVLSVGFLFPGGQVEYLPIESDRSLLDADVILFQPGIPDSYYGRYETHYQGKPTLSDSGSFKAVESANHWRSELRDAFEAGKTVIVFLARPMEVFVYTGQRQYSGTGRNARITNIVVPFSSYNALPITFASVIPKGGESIRIYGDLQHLTEYWKEYAAVSPYEVYVEGEFSKVLLTTKTADKVVGALVSGKGTMYFLPPLRYDEAAYTGTRKSGDYWNTKGVQFGARLLEIVLSIDASIRSGRESTPPPDWASIAQYRLARESELESGIRAISDQITDLQDRKRELASALNDSGSLRRLLFGTGSELEASVIDALRILGFDADAQKDNESEFDAVFSSTEGRFLGEVEGKDSKAINIDKLSQLERNIQEDFNKPNTSAYAHGVLFGNAHRLTPPAERSEFFTDKCVSGARRSGISLVRTPDLFAIARYVVETGDTAFAEECRKALRDQGGGIVSFRPIPKVEEVAGKGTTDDQAADTIGESV